MSRRYYQTLCRLIRLAKGREDWPEVARLRKRGEEKGFKGLP